jgi:streptogramin lyase
LICAAVVAILGPVAAAPAAELQYPLAIASDSLGETFYLADRNLPGVWKVAAGKRELFFEGSKKFRTPLNAPRCILVDAKGRVLVGDSATREVYRFDAEGKPQPLTKGGVGIPMSLAIDRQGTIFIADLETLRIYKIPDEGGEPTEFAVVPAPRGLTIDDEDRLWVVAGSTLLRITPDGKSETIFAGPAFEFAHNVRLDKEGTAYVCDGYAKAIWKIGADRKPVKWVSGEPFVNPVGIAWQGANLLVADPKVKKVFAVDPAGKVTEAEMLPAAP